MKINELKNFIKKVINEASETKEIDNLLSGLESVNILTLEIGDASKDEDKKINLAMAKFIGKNKATYTSENSDRYSDIVGLTDKLTAKSEKTIYYKNEDGYKTWILLKKYLTGKWQIVEREVEEGDSIDYFITKLK